MFLKVQHLGAGGGGPGVQGHPWRQNEIQVKKRRQVGRQERRKGGRKNGWMDGRKEGWKKGWMDGRKKKWMMERRKEQPCWDASWQGLAGICAQSEECRSKLSSESEFPVKNAAQGVGEMAVVKSTYYSYRGPVLFPASTSGSSQLPVPLALQRI